MIPWIESHVFVLGPLNIRTWGVFVALAFVVASTLAARRAKQRGLNPAIMWDAAFWVFVASMVGSRFFHVLFYQPRYYFQHPFEALNPTAPGFAILGGILAGALAGWLFLRRKKQPIIGYADAVAWALPWGFGTGRIGCFLIHDHPGTLTNFWLGVRYPDGSVRHDLGLDLSLFGFVLGCSFLAIYFIGKRRKIDWIDAPGFWVGLFLTLDGIGRFALDFLRIADTRWGPLTPTQWALIGSVSLGVWLLAKAKRSHIG